MNSIFKKIILFFVIPGTLLVLWMGLSLLLQTTTGLTIISYPYHRSNFSLFTTKELLAKQKVVATFQSKDKNLGIISVRFYNFDRINKDEVVFRIKEKGSHDWLYQHVYKVDQFLPNKLFTFGFTPQANSKGKNYYFEIESLRGIKGDAITLSSQEPVFTSRHQYEKKDLIASPVSFIDFLVKKTLTQFQDISFVLSTFIYFLPFLLYLVWLLFLRRYISNIKVFDNFLILTIFLVTVFFSIFLSVQENSLINSVFLLLWVALILIYKFDSSVSYFLSAICLLFCPLFILLNVHVFADNAATFAYLFLLVGCGESIIEIKLKKLYPISYSYLISKMKSKKVYRLKIWEK
jgi:hypothetical protein